MTLTNNNLPHSTRCHQSLSCRPYRNHAMHSKHKHQQPIDTSTVSNKSVPRGVAGLRCVFYLYFTRCYDVFWLYKVNTPGDSQIQQCWGQGYDVGLMLGVAACLPALLLVEGLVLGRLSLVLFCSKDDEDKIQWYDDPCEYSSVATKLRIGLARTHRCYERNTLTCREAKHAHLTNEYERCHGCHDTKARRDCWRVGGTRLAVALPCDVHSRHRIQNCK